MTAVALTAPGSARAVGRAELLRTLVERQLRLRAKRSLIGVVWPLLAPLMLFGLYAFVFGSVFDVPVHDYPAYLYVGLIPWTFLVQTVHDALQSISFEPELVRRAPFPYELLPLSRVVVMAIPFVILLAGFVVARVVTGSLHLELLPLLVVPVVSITGIVAGLALLMALFDVFNRDLRYVLNNLLTVWFFLVPIVYHPHMETGALRAVTTVDPMRLVIGQFRDVLYTGRISSPLSFALTTVGCVVFVVAALVVFRRLAVDLAQDV